MSAAGYRLMTALDDGHFTMIHRGSAARAASGLDRRMNEPRSECIAPIAGVRRLGDWRCRETAVAWALGIDKAGS